MSIFNTNFWDSFWPNFISSLLIGIIFSFVITFIIKLIRKPQLKVCLSIGTNIEGHSLIFYCLNTGSIGLMPYEIKWNIYFPVVVQPLKNFNERVDQVTLLNKPYNNVMGFNKESVLPGDSILLVYIPVKVNNKFAEYFDSFDWLDDVKYYYSITTIKGQKKYHSFFWDYFRKRKFIESSEFVKRPILEVKDKIL